MKTSLNNKDADYSTNIEETGNILEIINKYTTLYINSKIAANLSSKTIYNIKVILERFYDFIADEYTDNQFLEITDLSKYFLNNYLNTITQQVINKNTQKLHLTIIKGFLTFIADSELDKYGSLKLNLSGIKIKTVSAKGKCHPLTG